MRLLVGVFETLNTHVRVDLGGRQRGVSQHVAHCREICTIIQQMRCEGVTQNVRALSVGLGDRTKCAAHDPPCTDAGEALAAITKV